MNKDIEGFDDNAEVETLPTGGKQHKAEYRFDLLDAKALFEATKVLAQGADKYGEDNWRRIPARDHVNHAIIHLYAHLAGDTQEPHLINAFCRCMMAIATKEDKA